MTVAEIANRIWNKYFPEPEQAPTGRVCANCLKHIERNDKFKQLAVAHIDCAYPQGGSPLPKSLAENLDALTEAQ